MENIKEKRTIFLENIDPLEILTKFLSDNGFEESIDDAYEKIKKGEEPFTSVLSHATLSFSEKKIKEKELIEILEKGLNASKEIAKKLAKKIKNDLIPLTINIVIDDENIPQEKQTVSTNPIRSTKEEPNNIENKPQTPLEENSDKMPKSIEKNTKPPSILENKETTNKQDGYREPI